MAVITKLENLRENIKIARYCLQEAQMQADPTWLSKRVEEQEALISKANAEIRRLQDLHANAQNKTAECERNLRSAEKSLEEYVNRGQTAKHIDRAAEAANELLGVIEKLRAAGFTDEQLADVLRNGV